MRKITSLQHPLIKHLVKLRKDRHYRTEMQTVLIEGKTLFNELPSKYIVKNIITTTAHDSPHAFLVTEEIIQKISSLQKNDGFLAEIELPQEVDLSFKKPILILDSIGDPSNLGALLRSALAFNFEGVFLLNHCTDPFNDKALRAAKGATFRVPMQSGSWQELAPLLQKSQLTLFVGDLNGLNASQITGREGALLLGNEVHGPGIIPEEVKTETITIPINQEMESLNVSVAGGILMYLLQGRAK